MARINLLPWRAALRKQQRQEFFVVMGISVFVTILVMVYVHAYYMGRIEFQNQRNTYLANEIAILDKKIKEIDEIEARKKRLLAKIEIIQNLQAGRPESVHLFDELAKTIPDGIYLTNFQQTERNLSIEGITQSNARVSSYMLGVDASPWLEVPQLNIIQTEKNQPDVIAKLQNFRMQFKQTNPMAAEKK